MTWSYYIIYHIYIIIMFISSSFNFYSIWFLFLSIFLCFPSLLSCIPYLSIVFGYLLFLACTTICSPFLLPMFSLRSFWVSKKIGVSSFTIHRFWVSTILDIIKCLLSIVFGFISWTIHRFWLSTMFDIRHFWVSIGFGLSSFTIYLFWIYTAPTTNQNLSKLGQFSMTWTSGRVLANSQGAQDMGWAGIWSKQTVFWFIGYFTHP